MAEVDASVAVIVPNWNGIDTLKACINSLRGQTQPHTIIVVENGSTDGSLGYLESEHPEVKLVVNRTNLGFAGGVNSGIRVALHEKFDYIALFNNDATADGNWLKHLVATMEQNEHTGIVTSKILEGNGAYLDSTGDLYTIWGLPYPRGRGEHATDHYDHDVNIFAASGGASLYRAKMLEEIGLFDNDFFAYYEDVDISFRAQLAGWRVVYAPQALVYHQIGATSGKIRGFTTYMTIKNLPWLLVKNVPRPYLRTVLPRFLLAHTMFIGRAVLRGHGWSALKGVWVCVRLLPAKLRERKEIQHDKPVTTEYIWQMMTHDLPPNAHNLRRLRALWWKFTGR